MCFTYSFHMYSLCSMCFTYCLLFLLESEMMQASVLSADELTYPFTRTGGVDPEDALQFPPLEMPPEFDIPEDLDLSFSTIFQKSSLADS